MAAPQFITAGTPDLTRNDNADNRFGQTDVSGLAGIQGMRHGQRPRLSEGASAFGVIDDADGPDDSDFFESIAGTFSDVVATETANPTTTPVNDRNHALWLRVGKDSTGGQSLGCTLELRQTYTGETVLGTFVAALSVEVPDSATTYRYRLTTAEAARITDYTDLQFRFLMRKGGNGTGIRLCRVYWARLELPNSTDPNVDANLTPGEQKLQKRGVPLSGVVEAMT